jgi:two-component system chemotaxis response regulator CheY
MERDKTRRVLVVEDNPALRKVLVNIVKKLGYQDILEADDGLPAWRHVEQGGVGLVLADWSMPGMSGLELLNKIRAADAPTCDIPFVMITALDSKDSIVTAGAAGVDAYIIKPFSVGTISEKIDEALSKRESA